MTDVLGYAHAQAAAAAAADRLRSGLPAATVGIILGSGLGKVADSVVDSGGVAVSDRANPHIPTSAGVGHKGRLVFGSVGAKTCS